MMQSSDTTPPVAAAVAANVIRLLSATVARLYSNTCRSDQRGMGNCVRKMRWREKIVLWNLEHARPVVEFVRIQSIADWKMPCQQCGDPGNAIA